MCLVVFGRIRQGKPALNQKSDERISLIYAKSSRNALFGTYLAFFLHNLLTGANTLDSTWYMIILASGLGVLIVSFFVYFYTKI